MENKDKENKSLKIVLSAGQYMLYNPSGKPTVELPEMKKDDGKPYKSDSIGISVKPNEKCFVFVLNEKDYKEWKKQGVNF